MTAPSNRYEDGTYRRHNPDWHDEDSGHKALATWRFAGACGLQPDRVVDIGCGVGGVCRRLRDVWPSIEGWDIALAAIREAQNNDPCSTYVHGAYDQADQRTSLALLLDVVEHVDNDVRFLRAVAERCDDLILRVPLDWSVLDHLRPHRIERARTHYGHVHIYSRRSLLERLDEAGLTVLRVAYDRVPPGPPDTSWGHLTERIRRMGVPAAPSLASWLLGGFSVFVHARSAASPQDA